MAVAVFLDKDGTLVRDVPYNVDPALLELTPGVPAALRSLREADFALVLVSNQSGIGRGYFSAEAVERNLSALNALLRKEGSPLDGFYVCPHVPKDACACRKPQPGLLHRAASQMGLDLARSWMVGDILDDVEAGQRAGCRTILLDSGGETEWQAGPWRTPHAVATDMAAVVRIILGATAI